MPSKDIRTAPQAVRDFIRRQGISLNPLIIHATYRLPQDFKEFQPTKNRYRFFVIHSGATVSYLTKADRSKSGRVYEFRLREGQGGPKPAAPRVELRRVKAEVPVDDWETVTASRGTPGVDAFKPPRYFAQLLFQYPNGAGTLQNYSIQSGNQTFNGPAFDDSGRLALHQAGDVSYQVGDVVAEDQWQASLDDLQKACDALKQARSKMADIAQWPSRVQGLHLLNSQILIPGDPDAMPTELFSAGYPFAPLFETARTVWQNQHHRPDQFNQAFCTEQPIDKLVFGSHLGQTLGVAGLKPNSASYAFLDLIYLLSDTTLLQPLNDLAVSLSAPQPSDWSLEAALIALLSMKTPANAENHAGNFSPNHRQLKAIGSALHDLAEMLRQQALVLSVKTGDSQPVRATVSVPALSHHWPEVPEPNWVELNYNDKERPFPTGTQLRYWLYDDADELLYEGNDLTPGQPKRFLLPDSVEQVSYHFALPSKTAQPQGMADIFAAFGEHIIHWYDIGPFMDVETGRDYRSINNRGQSTYLRPAQVQQLQRAFMSLNLPLDERDHVLPNTYVLLADANTSFTDIKSDIEKQLGAGLTEDDWQLIDQQLTGLDENQPKILDLTWFYADLIFRATAERYEDAEVQRLTADLTRLAQLEKIVPQDPWWQRFSAQPTDEKTVHQGVQEASIKLQQRLDHLYSEQKQQNVLPYRHVNRELLEWSDKVLFTVCTFFVPVEQWAVKTGSALLALLRNKYFVGGAILGTGAYSGEAVAGKFKAPKLNIINGSVRAIAAKSLLGDAAEYGIIQRARNLPNYLNLDGNTAGVRRVLTGELPSKYALPAAPDGHHWVFPTNGKPFTKRNPKYPGERMDYDHETQRFYVKKTETTPGSTRYKAEFAEARGYDWAIAKGHKPVPGFRRPKFGEHGLDSLFYNASPPPKYLIIEMKYHKSTYGWIYIKDAEGTVVAKYKQMSDEWIKAKLEKHVSEELQLDIEIYGYEKYGLRYYPELDKMVPEGITW